MKKLLITTMAAVSVGLCAKAADDGFISGISFETLTAGGQLNAGYDDNGTDAGEKFWTSEASGDDLFTVTNITDYTGSNTYPSDNRPAKWSGVVNSNALAIDTANPILRNVNPKDGGTGENTAQNVSTKPVFFDSVVQFTATDVAPSMENNTTDKLAVWLYVSPESLADGVFGETEAKKNLVITAGEWVDGSLKTKHYLTDKVIEPDSWHRLTIKSFVKEGFDKFNVWVDGTLVVVEEVDAFDSLIDAQNTKNGTKLQGVAFDGKGAVDDIVFTTTDPFAVEVADAKLNITFNDFSAIDENEGVWYVVNDDEDNTITISDDSTEATLKAGDKVSVWFKLLEGYELVSPEVTPDEDDWYVITIDALTADGATIAIVTKEAVVSGGVTVGGTTVEIGEDGKIANITTAFDGKAVSGELDTTKFKSYYTAKVENGILSIKLDQKAAAPFAVATEDKEVLEVGEDASGNPKLTVRIKPYVGLYYGAMTGSALDNMTLMTDYQQATTDKVIEFTATGNAGDTAGFIKVVVTDIDPKAK